MLPLGSMYGIYGMIAYINHQNQPNVGKCNIHGSYGFISWHKIISQKLGCICCQSVKVLKVNCFVSSLFETYRLKWKEVVRSPKVSGTKNAVTEPPKAIFGGGFSLTQALHTTYIQFI